MNIVEQRNALLTTLGVVCKVWEHPDTHAGDLDTAVKQARLLLENLNSPLTPYGESIQLLERASEALSDSGSLGHDELAREIAIFLQVNRS